MTALWADIVAPRFCGLASIGATLAIAVAAFLLFGAVLAFPLLRGRKVKRRCACSASREVMRILEERERAARDAALYDPKTVDVADLPQTSPELAEYSRVAEKSAE